MRNTPLSESYTKKITKKAYTKFKTREFLQGLNLDNSTPEEVEKDRNPLNLPYQRIADRNKFFEETVPLAKELINTFLAELGISLEHTIFAGGEHPDTGSYEPRGEEYLFATKNRLIPSRYTNDNFTAFETARSCCYEIEALGNTRYGITHYNHRNGTEIRMQESQNGLKVLPDLVHEYVHQIMFPENALRNLAINAALEERRECGMATELTETEKNEFSRVIKEGSVELLKRIIIQQNFDYDYFPTYNNEVNLMFHLLKNVAEKLGTPGYPKWKPALKTMVEWMISGGTEKPFVRLCKQIKTTSFPVGFDIYGVDPNQLKRLKSFMSDQPYFDTGQLEPLLSELKPNYINSVIKTSISQDL